MRAIRAVLLNTGSDRVLRLHPFTGRLLKLIHTADV